MVLSAIAASPREAAFPGLDRRIAYVGGRRLYVVTSLGDWKLLPPRVDASRIAWSPDGRRLLISAGRVYLTTAAARRLDPIPLRHSWRRGPPDASWSPSGDAIIF